MKRKKTQEKGITLIVLIIIIVAVIAVIGATVFLITNGKTNDSKMKTENIEKKSNALAGVYTNATDLAEVKMGFTQDDEKKYFCSVKMPIDYYFIPESYNEKGDNVDVGKDKENEADSHIFYSISALCLKDILERTSLDESNYAVSKALLISTREDNTKISVGISSNSLEEFKSKKEQKNGTDFGTSEHPAYYYVSTDEYVNSNLTMGYKVNEDILLTIHYYKGPLADELGLAQLAENMYNLITVEGENDNSEKVSTKQKNSDYNDNISKITLTTKTDLSSSKLSLEDAGIDKEGDVTIPETVNYKNTTYKVTAIGDYCFKNCNNLNSISISDSVTDIGERAFWECSELKEVKLSDKLIEIGEMAFWGCTSLQEIQIPTTVSSIESKAFYGCSNLKKIELPKNNSGFDYLSYSIFENCSSLEEIELPKSLKEISATAFSNCKSLKNIKIPDGVKEIRTYTFSKCSSLESIEWHDEIYTNSEEFNKKFADGKAKIWTK